MEIGNERTAGLLRGAVGSLAGLVAMGAFFKASQAFSGNGKPEQEKEPDVIERQGALDDISLVGQQAEDDEASTEAVGRIGYRVTTGHEPDEETRERLGQAVHWGYGVLLGSLYGALRADVDGPDLIGGLGYGTAAWVLGDEIMVPMLGLAEGPTAHGVNDHAMALGAHLVYGAATASATQALKRVM